MKQQTAIFAKDHFSMTMMMMTMIRKNTRKLDHCHMTGKYRGAAHSGCNLKLKINSKEPWRNKIPVFFHNLRGFDGHLIMQALARSKATNLKCIANNMEKYMTFSAGQFDFKDSLQHLNAALEKLVGSLSVEQLKQTRNHLPTHFDLIRQKGFYPYDYMDSHENFKETALPPIKDFYSDIKQCGISDKEYAHAKTVWDTFEMKNMGEYHDLYLKRDVLLLAAVFETYRACNPCIL